MNSRPQKGKEPENDGDKEIRGFYIIQIAAHSLLDTLASGPIVQGENRVLGHFSAIFHMYMSKSGDIRKNPQYSSIQWSKHSAGSLVVKSPVIGSP